jgi:DMSO/TMAO reductase YedYZ molybdopterin-dependent catalytic subunit
MFQAMRAFAVGFVFFAGAAALAASHAPDSSKYVTTSVIVSGAVENALTLRVEDLRSFGPSQTAELTMLSQSSTSPGRQVRLKGVRLRDILVKAGVLSRNHNDVKKTVVVATASDGYKWCFRGASCSIRRSATASWCFSNGTASRWPMRRAASR